MRFSKAYLCLLKGSYMEKELAPPPGFLPGESRDGGAWWAAVYGVAQSRTRQQQQHTPRLPFPPTFPFSNCKFVFYV